MAITEDAEEVELKVHIVGLLKDYIPRFVARDHIQHSQDLVSEIFPDILNHIPEHEPTMPALPLDPLTSLATRLELLDLSPYQETWSTTAESVQLLQYFKNVMSNQNSSKSLYAISDDIPTRIHVPPRPISPTLLSQRAHEQTPQLTKARPTILNSKTSGSAIKKYIPSGVAIEEPGIPECADLEEILDTKLSLPADERAKIISLQKSNPFLSLTTEEAKRRMPSKVEAFLSSSSSLADTSSKRGSRLYRPISPPIFVREKCDISTLFGSSKNTTPQTPSDLAKFLHPVTIPKDIEDEDIADENMKIVEGWDMLPTISSQLSLGTPSLCMSTSAKDELDEELWLPTSSPKPGDSITEAKGLASLRLMDSQLHEYMMPRVKDPLYQAKETARDAIGDNYTSFIKSVLPRLHGVDPNQKAEEPPVDKVGGADTCQSNAVDALSVTGQLGSDDPSKRCEVADKTTADDTPKKEFDSAIRGLYDEVIEEDYGSLIAKEKIDESAMVFMDVPNLPPPSEFKRKYSLPTRMSMLVITDKHSLAGNGENEGDFRLLKKAKGLKSLNLELSWRPFSFGKSIPTNEEVLDILNFLSPEIEATTQHLLRPLEEDCPSQNNVYDRILYESLLAKNSPEVEAAIKNLLNLEVTNDEMRLIFTRKETLKMMGKTDVDDVMDEHTDFTSHLSNVETPYFPEEQQKSEQPPRLCLMGQDEEDRELECGFMGPQSYSMGSTPPIDMSHVTGSEWDAPAEPVYQWPEYADSNDLALPHFEEASNNNVHDSGFQTTSLSPHRNTPTADMEIEDVRKEELAPDTPVVNEDNKDEEPLFDFTQLLPFEKPPIPEGYVSMDELATLRAQSHRDRWNSYMRKRGKECYVIPDSEPFAPSSPATKDINNAKEQPLDAEESSQASTPKVAPEELFKSFSALTVPTDWTKPSHVLRVFISGDLLQRRALFRMLTSPEFCAFAVIERDQLSGRVDIAINPDAAVICFTLAFLPAFRMEFIQRICGASSRFKKLLVIFEAFATARIASRPHAAGDKLTPYAYGPPVLNALSRFKRDLALHQGSGELAEDCSTQFAFTNTIEESAKLIRHFTDISMENSGDVSQWLSEDEPEEERDLASMIGMNNVIANVMLSQAGLDEILSMSSEQRLHAYGAVLGTDRMTRLNRTLDERIAIINNTLLMSSD